VNRSIAGSHAKSLRRQLIRNAVIPCQKKRKRPPRDKLGTVHLEIWTRRKWGFRCKVSVRPLRVRGQFGTWLGAIETWLVRHPSNALLRAHYAAIPPAPDRIRRRSPTNRRRVALRISQISNELCAPCRVLDATSRLFHPRERNFGLPARLARCKLCKQPAAAGSVNPAARPAERECSAEYFP
jgi:hypothetical protein